jgi:hypothetical protein
MLEKELKPFPSRPNFATIFETNKTVHNDRDYKPLFLAVIETSGSPFSL